MFVYINTTFSLISSFSSSHQYFIGTKNSAKSDACVQLECEYNIPEQTVMRFFFFGFLSGQAYAVGDGWHHFATLWRPIFSWADSSRGSFAHSVSGQVGSIANIRLERRQLGIWTSPLQCLTSSSLALHSKSLKRLQEEAHECRLGRNKIPKRRVSWAWKNESLFPR